MDEILTRLMTPADLDICLHLRDLVGWNQLRSDWESILALEPNGCFVAVEGGQIVGTATTTVYGDAFGWIGLVIVHPDFRRRGIGRKLLEACIEHIGPTRAARLDATPAGKRLYDKLGFFDDVTFARYLLNPAAAKLPLFDSGAAIRPLRENDLPALGEWDAVAFGHDRSELLTTWWHNTPEYAFVAEQEGKTVGYCLGRHGLNYETVGPVVALDSGTAANLICHVIGKSGDKPVNIDAFELTPDFCRMLKDMGFVHQRPFIRMTRGDLHHPGIPERIWAVCGPEVG